MICRVTINDHIAKREHVSTWNVTDDEGYTGAMNAAYVKAFGSCPRRVETHHSAGGYARLYVMGMWVEIERVPTMPRSSYKRRERWERKSDARIHPVAVKPDTLTAAEVPTGTCA